MTTTPQYPEHEKLHAVADESQAFGEFLDWLKMKYTLCARHEDEDTFYPCYTPVQTLLAEFFEIDENKLEEEKRAMLEELRKGTEP